MTCLGSLTVYLKNVKNNILLENMLMSFSGGVMLSASIFSLLIPSFEYGEMFDLPIFIPSFVGVLVGAAFIMVFDIIISSKEQGNIIKNKKMYIAVTLHNVPEGLSVGLMFGLALNGYEDITIISGILLALGIGIQNLPEGAALALPLEKTFNSKNKAFLFSCLSGAIEPISAIIGLLLATNIIYLMPWLLCFSAGAMIYVVIDELIISSINSKEKRLINIAFIFGFLLMMILDVSF